MKTDNRKKISLLLIPLAVLITGLAVWGPEKLAGYRDRQILDRIRSQAAETGTAGYRYALSSNDKLYILSKCLNNQILPESDQNAMTRPEENRNLDYQELTGTYAMVVNRKDANGQEVEEEDGIELCNQGIQELKEIGILPESVRELTEWSYSAVLYSAIDVPEPRNNVLVWKISLDTGKETADRSGRILDVCMDADTGRIYEFYVRTDLSGWQDVDPDAIIKAWANPLSETTPYFKKYTFSGMESGVTVVTVGFYEGINELFLKISR